MEKSANADPTAHVVVAVISKLKTPCEIGVFNYMSGCKDLHTDLILHL
jgi:hypothetical protein